MNTELLFPHPEHFYSFRNKPDRVLRALQAFAGLEEQLAVFRKKWAQRQWLLLLLLIVVGSVLTNLPQSTIVSDSITMEPPQSAVGMLAISPAVLGLLFYLLLFGVNKLFRSVRYVNPSSGSRAVIPIVIGAIFLACWAGPLFAVFGGALVVADLNAARMFSWSHDSWALLAGVLYSAGVLFFVSRFFWLRRIKLVTPQKGELFFCRRILGALLSDLPANRRCQVSFNPFPALWSEEKVKLPNGRDAWFDCLLRAEFDFGEDQACDILLLHRRTGKGQRKHKGWKHKVKLRICLSDPRVKELPDKETLKQQLAHTLNDIKVATAANSKDDAELQFRVEPDLLGFELRKEGNTLSYIETAVEPCAWGKTLKMSLLPHPDLVLGTIQGLSLLTVNMHPAKARS